MEYAAGGDMFEYVVRKGGLRESEARWFFQQLIVAVDYIHRMVRGHVVGMCVWGGADYVCMSIFRWRGEGSGDALADVSKRLGIAAGHWSVLCQTRGGSKISGWWLLALPWAALPAKQAALSAAHAFAPDPTRPGSSQPCRVWPTETSS